MRAYTVTLLLTALVVSGSTASFAAGGKGLGRLLGAGMRAANGVKTYDANTLRPEALKVCVQMDRALETEGVAIDAVQTQLNKKSGTLDQLRGRIDSLDAYLQANKDRQMTSQSEVDAFNGKVNEYNTLLERYNLEVDRFTSMSDPLNARIDNYNTVANKRGEICNGKRYYEDDMEQVLAQLD